MIYHQDAFDDAHRMIRALNHALRQKIIKMLLDVEEGELTVTDVYVRLRTEQSVASQHLAILRRAGIVRGRKDGKNVYYSVDDEHLNEVLLRVEHLAELMPTHRRVTQRKAVLA